MKWVMTMKEIIINEDKMTEEEVTGVVKRAKLVVENSKGELLLVKCHDNCYLIGGHVDGEEEDNDTLIREIKEEAGIDYDPKVEEPFYSIKYYCRDYPEEGKNTKYISNYYSVKYDLEPNIDNVSLTDDEAEGGFELVYIPKDKILDEMSKILETCTRKNVVKDTIAVIEEYLSK